MTDIPTITQEEAVEVRARLTRPIIGIENRTPQEAFDIMCDRFRGAALSPNMDHAVGGVRERAAISDYLLACSAEADRQRLNMLGAGNKLTARDCKSEAKAYANAAAMIEREDHASYRAALTASTPPVNQDAVREALEQIAANNWKDPSRARHVARSALATPPLDNTGLDAATVEALDPWRRVFAIAIKPFDGRNGRSDGEGVGPLLPTAWPTIGDLRRLATLASGDRS